MLLEVANTVLSPFETFTSYKFWRIYLVFIVFITALTFQFPRYQFVYKYAVAHTETNTKYNVFLKQKAFPFKVYNTDTKSHESKMVFRFLVPLIARVFNLSIIGVFILQALVGLAMYYALILLIEKITRDKVTTVLLVFGLSFTYFGSAFVNDVIPFFDSFGYAVLVFLMALSNPVALLVLAVAGGFIDERVLLASLLPLLWHAYRYHQAHGTNWLRSYLNPQSLALIGAWVVYVVIRLVLTHHYALTTYGGDVGLHMIFMNAWCGTIEMGFLSGLEAYWLLAVLVGAILWLKRAYWLLALLTLSFLPVFGAAFAVWDTTRSLAYGMPVVVLLVAILRQHISTLNFRVLALIVVFFSLLTPSYSNTAMTQIAGFVYSRFFM